MNSVSEHSHMTITIYDLFILLRRYLSLIVVAGLIGGIITFCICSLFISPVYEANAKMIVNSRQEQTGFLTNDQITSSQKLVNTYAIIIRSQPVLEPVIEQLNLPMSAEKLAKKISVTPVNETQVMQIAVQSKDAEMALRIVEEIVSICPPIIIEAVEAGSVKTIEPAHLLKEPVAPKTNLLTVIAAFLCMVLVVVGVVLRFLMDNTYNSEMDLRNDLEIPILGVIPDYNYAQKQTDEVKEGKRFGKV